MLLTNYIVFGTPEEQRERLAIAQADAEKTAGTSLVLHEVRVDHHYENDKLIYEMWAIFKTPAPTPGTTAKATTKPDAA